MSSLRLTIAIAVMGQLEDTKGAWGCLVANTVEKENVELLVINNGSTDGTAEFLERFILPHFPTHRVLYHPENIGVIKSLDEIHKNASGEVIAILHNDVYVFEHGWNTRVMQEFEHDPKLGLAGFLGAEGIGANGGRIHTYSNLLEAEIHGARDAGVHPVTNFDGLSLIARKAMLDAVGGFDQEYTYHHFYDRDASLASYTSGWTNKMIGVYCHHRSGVTANRPDYQNWISQKMQTEPGRGDNASYLLSEQRFLTKWKNYLPIII